MNELIIAEREPSPLLRYRRKVRLDSAVRDMWRSRPIVWALAQRELRARYKQAILGAGWAFIGPLGYVLVFTVFFNKVAKVDTQGVPYVLFSYVGLIPWTFFSATLLNGSLAPLANLVLLNKISCPREVFTLSAMLTAAVDTAVVALALPVLFAVNGFMPRLTTLWTPAIFGVQLAFGLGLALLLGSVLFYVRDIRHMLPIIAQLLLFATPVAYGMEAISRRWQTAYSIANPMAAIIDSYRRTVLYGQHPDWSTFGPAAVVAALLLVAGYVVFKRLETGFADVA